MTSCWESIHKVLHSNTILLNTTDKLLVHTRLHNIWTDCIRKYKQTKTKYIVSRCSMVTLGILNPALISMLADSCDNKLLYTVLYWSVWVLQITAGLVTGYVTFFRWDKQYYRSASIVHQLEKEVWSYLECSGSYKFTPEIADASSHKANLERFIEKIELFKDSINHLSDLQTTDYNTQKREDNNQEEDGGGDGSRYSMP